MPSSRRLSNWAWHGLYPCAAAEASPGSCPPRRPKKQPAGSGLPNLPPSSAGVAEYPKDFAQAVAEASTASISLMPWEGERACSIRQFLERAEADGNLADPKHSEQKAVGRPAAISVLIGPEGGFTADEVELARQAGITTVTIGRRILRTETAGAAVLAMLIYQFDEF